MPLSRALYTTHFLPTAPHLLPMTHLSIQWGWVGGGGKSQETSEVQKRVGQQQQQQQSRISGEKLLSIAAEQSPLYIVSFSFCVRPPTTAIAIKGYFTRFHFQTVSWRGIIIPRHYSCLRFAFVVFTLTHSLYSSYFLFCIEKEKDLGRV